MFIKLTRVYKELTEEAQERLDKVEETLEKKAMESDKDFTDDNGNDAEWYKNLNLPVPDFLIDGKEIIYEESVELKEEDYYEVVAKYVCNTEQVEDFEESDEKTLIIYKSGRAVVVKESLEEINIRIFAS